MGNNKEDWSLIPVELYITKNGEIKPHERRHVELKSIPRKGDYYWQHPDGFYEVIDVIYYDLGVKILLGKIANPGVYGEMLKYE